MLLAGVGGLGSGGSLYSKFPCLGGGHLVGVFEGGEGGSLHGVIPCIMANGHMGTTSQPVDRQT